MAPFTSADAFQRLTAGGTFSRTFAVFRKRWDLFLIIAGIIFIPLALMAVSIMTVIGSSMSTLLAGIDASAGLQVDENGTIVYSDGGSSSAGAADFYDGSSGMDVNPFATFGSFGLQFVLEYLALLIFAVAGKGAIAYAVAQIYVDRNPSWLECLQRGFSKWCTLFCASFLVGLGTGVVNAVVNLVASLMFGKNMGFLALVGFLILVAWFVVLIYILVSLMIIAPVVMIEGKSPVASIQRCWELSSNNRCYIFCTVFCLALVYYLAQIILAAIAMAIGGADALVSTWGAFLILLPALAFLPLTVM